MHGMTLRTLFLLPLLAGLGLLNPTVAQAKPPLVLAAASLQESLTAAGDAWAARRHEKPVLSFAASSALARQIDSGAPADLFISADEPWMDDVQKNGMVRPGTRVSFLANRLVLVAPAGKGARLTIGRGFPLARALGTGRLAMADPDAVPAGKYGRAALTALGVWPAVAPRSPAPTMSAARWRSSNAARPPMASSMKPMRRHRRASASSASSRRTAIRPSPTRSRCSNPRPARRPRAFAAS